MVTKKRGIRRRAVRNRRVVGGNLERRTGDRRRSLPGGSPLVNKDTHLDRFSDGKHTSTAHDAGTKTVVGMIS